MSKLTQFISRLDDRKRLALCAVGVMSVLLGTPASAGDFYRGGRTVTVYGLRDAVALNERVTENLRDLIDVVEAFQRIDLFTDTMSGVEKSNRIKIAYLHEYTRAPYPQLRKFDRALLKTTGDTDERVAEIVEDANEKKRALRVGMDMLESVTEALRAEDYGAVQYQVDRLTRFVESEGIPALQGSGHARVAGYGGYSEGEQADASEGPVFGFRFGN